MFLSLTAAFGAEGCGGGSAAIKKGHGFAVGYGRLSAAGCVEGLWKRFMDTPAA